MTGTEFVMVNGHLPTCAYIQSLDYFDNDDADCSCGADDDDGNWDDDGSDYYVDGDTGW